MLTGNREYNEIYKKYKNLVLKVAYIYSGDNYDAAEDITQDTFLKLYIGFEELKDGNVSAWLYTTAKNSALNFNKKFKREVLSEDDELYKNKEQFGESLETEFIEKEEVLYKKQFHEKIMAALSKKNPRLYEAIILVYYMDIPQVKVAEIMEIRKEVLHALLHRAKKWIRKKFGAEYEEMQDKDGRIP